MKEEQRRNFLSLGGKLIVAGVGAAVMEHSAGGIAIARSLTDASIAQYTARRNLNNPFLMHGTRLNIAHIGMASLLMAGISMSMSADIPIYMFHQTSGGPVEAVLASELGRGRKPVTVATANDILRGNEVMPAGGVFCLTFDDGYKIQYTSAYPVLERYKTPATFYVMSPGWNGDRVHTYMDWDQIQELADNGHEIGSHTVNHVPNLVYLRSANWKAYLAEVFGSKEQIEQQIGHKVRTFCYPNGVYNQAIIDDVINHYEAAVSTVAGTFQNLELIQQLRRSRVN